MKLPRRILPLVLAAGLLAILTPFAAAQASVYGARLVSASESPAYRLTGEAVPVRSTLRKFSAALATHDTDKLRSVGINRMTARRWKRFFDNNPRATISDDCPVSDLYISDDTAIWTCTETATIISEGRPRSFDHVIRFTFVKRGGTWLIAKRR